MGRGWLAASLCVVWVWGGRLEGRRCQLGTYGLMGAGGPGLGGVGGEGGRAGRRAGERHARADASINRAARGGLRAGGWPASARRSTGMGAHRSCWGGERQFIKSLLLLFLLSSMAHHPSHLYLRGRTGRSKTKRWELLRLRLERLLLRTRGGRDANSSRGS